jgi:predicted molibdopterin-dependent oxidoreductase YjgC
LIMATSLQSNAVGTISILGNPSSPEAILGNQEVTGLFVYEDDPFHYLGEATAGEAFKRMSHVTVCDAFSTGAGDYAHVRVHTGSFAEKEGTHVAGDGFLREVHRARGERSSGFEFLRMLLERLGGGLYRDEKEAMAGLSTRNVLVDDGKGTVMLSPMGGKTSFLIAGTGSETPSQRTHDLILRSLLLSHHVSGGDAYSAGVALASDNNPPIAGDRLYISKEDAEMLGVLQGDMVVLESDRGTAKRKVSVKDGLKKGVLQYTMFRERRDMLELSRGYNKVIRVTVKKG